MQIQRFVLPAKNIRSLCWQGNELIDWVGGGNHYCLNGTTIPRYVNYSYRFNQAIVSPDGQYAVIYEVLGTKGVILKSGEVLREINRSYYQAHVYEYPVLLFSLPSGRTLLAHCPEEYNKLEIEDAETGERLTKRRSEPIDFFHSRLRVSVDGKYLMNAGWIWHPFDYILLYNIEEILTLPELLDAEPDWSMVDSSTEIHDAAFSDAETVVLATADAYYEEDNEEEKDQFILRPDQIGR